MLASNTTSNPVAILSAEEIFFIQNLEMSEKQTNKMNLNFVN